MSISKHLVTVDVVQVHNEAIGLRLAGRPTRSSLLFSFFISNGDWIQQQDDDANQYWQTTEQIWGMPCSSEVSQEPYIGHTHVVHC